MRKFLGSLFAGTLVLGMVACSGSESAPAGSAGAGTGGSASGSSGSSGTSASGSGTSAGTSSSGSGNTGSSDPDQIVGSFVVQLKVDREMTAVVGKVSDGPVPANLVWTEKKKDGECRLETPKTPFCEEACGVDVCAGDGQCRPYPTGHSVGAVTLKGVKVSGGATETPLREIAASYQPAAATLFEYPSFGAADTIEVTAEGDYYAGFSLSAPGVNPIDLKTTDFALSPEQDFVLEWDPAPSGATSQMHVKVDLSHHGGVKGLIYCDAPDTGSLTISKAMIAELIGLGVAGFPSVVLTRSSVDTAQLDHGKVELEVSALVERYLTVPGVESCTADEECAEGQTCSDAYICE